MKKRKAKKRAAKDAVKQRAERHTPSNAARQLRGNVVDVMAQLLDQGRHAEALEVVGKLEKDNENLRKILAQAQQQTTSSNERISSEQLKLALGALVAARQDQSEEDQDTDKQRDNADDELETASKLPPREKDTKPPQQPRGPKRPPEGLRRVPVHIPVPESERTCGRCDAETEVVGERITEVIELIPAEVVVREEHRDVMQCPRCDAPRTTAPTGDRVVEGGLYGPGLVSQIFVDKYDLGMPLHRQRHRYTHLGLPLNVSTMADQIKWSCELLRPMWRLCERTVLDAAVMQLDGTSLKVLDKDAASGKRLGTLWGYVGDGQTALYLYCSSGHKNGQREGDRGPEDVLRMRKGPTVADAASVFDASFARDDLIECGCNMHARRYFVKALDSGDKRAARPLAAYKKLYAIERDLRDLELDAITAGRQQRARPVYDALLHWATVHEPHVEPQSPLGKAIGYLLRHQLALTRYLDDGRIPPDNGATERLHVRAALTRKNYLFAGSDAGAERAAIAYTILGSCRLCGIDPLEYLADIIPRLQGKVRQADLADLLPAQWKRLRDTQA